MQINPYINFAGTCREAFELYKEVFGGEIVMMQTFGESPVAEHVPAETRDMIIHARLEFGGNVLMGSDAPPDRYEKPAGYYVSLQTDSPEEADRIYKVLSEGGTVEMELQPTFWAARFGMFTDRFGTPWMLNCDQKEQG